MLKRISLFAARRLYKVLFFKKLRGCPEKRKKRKSKKNGHFSESEKKNISHFSQSHCSLSLSFSDYKKTSLKRRALFAGTPGGEKKNEYEVFFLE